MTPQIPPSPRSSGQTSASVAQPSHSTCTPQRDLLIDLRAAKLPVPDSAPIWVDESSALYQETCRALHTLAPWDERRWLNGLIFGTDPEYFRAAMVLLKFKVLVLQTAPHQLVRHGVEAAQSDRLTLRARFDLLKQAGVGLDEHDGFGETAFHLCVTQSANAHIAVLIQAGANVNVANAYGFTPLHLAVATGNGTALEALLAHGAQPNCPDPLGRTPLHFAAMRNDSAALARLLAAGASPHNTDSANLGPLAASQDPQIRRLLAQAGAMVPLHQIQATSTASSMSWGMSLLDCLLRPEKFKRPQQAGRSDMVISDAPVRGPEWDDWRDVTRLLSGYPLPRGRRVLMRANSLAECDLHAGLPILKMAEQGIPPSSVFTKPGRRSNVEGLASLIRLGLTHPQSARLLAHDMAREASEPMAAHPSFGPTLLERLQILRDVFEQPRASGKPPAIEYLPSLMAPGQFFATRNNEGQTALDLAVQHGNVVMEHALRIMMALPRLHDRSPHIHRGQAVGWHPNLATLPRRDSSVAPSTASNPLVQTEPSHSAPADPDWATLGDDDDWLELVHVLEGPPGEPVLPAESPPELAANEDALLAEITGQHDAARVAWMIAQTEKAKSDAATSDTRDGSHKTERARRNRRPPRPFSP